MPKSSSAKTFAVSEPMEEKMEDLMVEAEAIEVEAEEAIQEAEIVAEEAQVFYDEQIYINLCMIKEGNFKKSSSLMLPPCGKT